jgi:hypothetical protein
MPILRQELVELVKGKMDELNFNPYDVERNSGGKITHTTVRNIIGSKVGEIKDETLETLSGVLHIPIPTLYRAAGIINEKSSEFSTVIQSFITDLNKLPEEDRQFIISNIEMLHREINRRASLKSPGRAKGKDKKMDASNSSENGVRDIDIAALVDQIQASHPHITEIAILDILEDRLSGYDEETIAIVKDYESAINRATDPLKKNRA